MKYDFPNYGFGHLRPMIEGSLLSPPAGSEHSRLMVFQRLKETAARDDNLGRPKTK